MDADVRKFRKFLINLEEKDQNIVDLSIPGIILYADYAGPVKSKCKHYVHKVTDDGCIIYLLNGQESTACIWNLRINSKSCLIDQKLVPFITYFYLNRYSNSRTIDLLKGNFKLIRNLSDLDVRTSYDLLLQIRVPGETNPKKAFGIDPRIFKNCRIETHYQMARKIQSILSESYKFYENIRWNRLFWNLTTFQLQEWTAKNIRYLVNLPNEDQDYYADYRRQRSILELTTKQAPLYPQHGIRILHDQLQERVAKKMALDKQLDEAKIQTDYIENYYEKAKKYEHEFDKYQIIACKNLSDLIEEGKALHHCVGSYIDSVASGKEYILFLRRKTNPNKPLYTIDISADNELRQIHGLCNKNLPESLIKMITPWAEKFNLDLSHASGVCCHL